MIDLTIIFGMIFYELAALGSGERLWPTITSLVTRRPVRDRLLFIAFIAAVLGDHFITTLLP